MRRFIWRHGWLFIDQFLYFTHHFARYLTDNIIIRPPGLLLSPGPHSLSLTWSIFVIDGLLKTVGRLRKHDDSLRNDSGQQVSSFCGRVAVVAVVFFSVYPAQSCRAMSCLFFQQWRCWRVNACPDYEPETVVGLSGSRRRFWFSLRLRRLFLSGVREFFRSAAWR